MATRSRDVLVAQTPSWRAKARHPRLFLAACGKVVGGGPSPATTLNGRPEEMGSDFRRSVLVHLAGSGDSVPGRACGPDSVMAGEGPPSTTFPGACGKVV